MSLKEKYNSLIDLAARLEISDLVVEERDGVLRITGAAPSGEAKQHLWNEYNRLDPDYRSGDLVLDISAPEASAAATYSVKPGDTLSSIGAARGVSWQKIFEANRDKLKDPDKIFPGQELTIP